jgi:hypothetical protein
MATTREAAGKAGRRGGPGATRVGGALDDNERSNAACMRGASAALQRTYARPQNARLLTGSCCGLQLAADGELPGRGEVDIRHHARSSKGPPCGVIRGRRLARAAGAVSSVRSLPLVGAEAEAGKRSARRNIAAQGATRVRMGFERRGGSSAEGTAGESNGPRLLEPHGAAVEVRSLRRRMRGPLIPRCDLRDRREPDRCGAARNSPLVGRLDEPRR